MAYKYPNAMGRGANIGKLSNPGISMNKPGSAGTALVNKIRAGGFSKGWSSK